MWRLQLDERRDGSAPPAVGEAAPAEPGEPHDLNPAPAAAAAAALRSAS
jgi:hypothetical protein